MPTQSKKVDPKQSSFAPLGSMFESYEIQDKGGYITQEFQDFGYRLSCELGDEKHKSLYIKLAKTVPRKLLEEARSFVIDADSAKSKARLFMWKLKQLREAKKNITPTK
ncbi:hypothetical protein KC921_00790 [Candidatus Woesebacteria bacterium]|nr:hypothetical protein [Candidatus Woesebacteria bacterium]